MVRSTLLHLCLLVAPSGKIRPSTKCMVSWHILNFLMTPSFQKIRFPISAWWNNLSILMPAHYFFDLLWQSSGPEIHDPSPLASYNMQFSERHFKPWKNESVVIRNHWNCIFAAAGAQESGAKHSPPSLPPGGPFGEKLKFYEIYDFANSFVNHLIPSPTIMS